MADFDSKSGAVVGEPIPRLPIERPRPKGLAPYTPRPGSKNSDLLRERVIAGEAKLHEDGRRALRENREAA